MADDTANLTVEILKQIRDESRKTNDRLDRLGVELRDELHAVGEKVDATNDRLDRTVDRLERVDSGLSDLGRFMRQIAIDQARHERFHVHHVDRLENDVRDLRERVSKLENR